MIEDLLFCAAKTHVPQMCVISIYVTVHEDVRPGERGHEDE